MTEETLLTHLIPVDELTGAISVPIYQTSTFVQEAPGVHKGFDYSRTNNPTRQVLERLIAQLEHAHAGFAFASGLAAIDAVLKTLSTGDHIVAVNDIYGGTFRILNHVYQKFGIEVSFVDTSDLQAVTNALAHNTKLVWVESPTNPTLKISDIQAIAQVAHANNSLLVVDNTFATPYLQKPIKLGADIVIHSATKYLAGHSDVLAGLVAVASQSLAEQLKFIQNSSGGVLGPWDCWLTIRGIETLALRMDKHCQNAQAVAHFLKQSPLVKTVYYPGIPEHKNHVVAKTQMKDFGGMLSFTLVNDTEKAAALLVTNTHVFRLAESLGGVKSLLCHPASMTHKSIPEHIRQASGISNSLIRLSCGIESAADLIADLDNALKLLKF
jgi:cystathionine beta-lyase